jgi:2-polyprenyl-6-hydroxyphenyl methylase/3-demethylubiquinone-9 3-methyltransferase
MKVKTWIYLPVYMYVFYSTVSSIVSNILSSVDRTKPVSDKVALLNSQIFDDITYWTTQEARIQQLNKVKLPYFIEHLEPGSHVLDVGCGAGFQAELLASTNFTVVGVDVSVASVAFAEERFILGGHFQAEQLKCLVGSVYDLPFPDESFDAVVISDTIEHIHDLPRAVDEISRVLKDRAVVVFDTFNRSPYSYIVYYLLMQKIFAFIPRDAHDYRLFTTPEELVQLFWDRGFSTDLHQWRGIKVNVESVVARHGLPEFTLVPGDLSGTYIGFFTRDS